MGGLLQEVEGRLGSPCTARVWDSPVRMGCQPFAVSQPRLVPSAAPPATSAKAVFEKSEMLCSHASGTHASSRDGGRAQ